MLDAFLLKILLYLKILEFRSIVAPDLLYLKLKFILGSRVHSTIYIPSIVAPTGSEYQDMAVCNHVSITKE